MGDINIVSSDTDELVITSDRASVSFAFFSLNIATFARYLLDSQLTDTI